MGDLKSNSVGNQGRSGTGEVTPLTWLLLDERPGHRTQVIGVSEALGWPCEIKEIRFNPLHRMVNRLLGASVLSLNTSASDRLEPPWPDLIIAMGRRSQPIARWVKRQSGDRARLVQLGRKAANLKGAFDLAVTCRHFRLPADPARLEVILPPTKVTERELQSARERWPEILSGLAHPRVLLLAGGDTALHRLSPAAAQEMASAVQDFALAQGGSLVIADSRRTSRLAREALRHGADQARIFPWVPDQADNPYLGLMAQADLIVVTGESESMLAEAVATRRPLYIYPLEELPKGPKGRFQEMVLRHAMGRGFAALASFCRWLLDQGLVVPRRDLRLLHRALVEKGLACQFGIGQASPGGGLTEERDAIRQRIVALLPEVEA